jgi:hypothetical protein
VSIDTTGKWWVGTEPDDIACFLRDHGKDSYHVHEFRLSRCRCGSVEFHLDADDNAGVAKRTCVKCKSEHFICDCAKYWGTASPERCRCVVCPSDVVNIGVGYSLYPESSTSILWVYIGVRCVRCGLLGCFAGWKICQDDVAHLFEQA